MSSLRSDPTGHCFYDMDGPRGCGIHAGAGVGSELSQCSSYLPCPGPHPVAPGVALCGGEVCSVPRPYDSTPLSALKDLTVGMVTSIPDTFVDWGKQDYSCFRGSCNYGRLALDTAFVAATILTAGELGAADGAAEGALEAAVESGAREEAQVLANQAAGNAARDAIAATVPGAEIEVRFETEMGFRQVDVLTTDRVAIESKVGYTTLTDTVQKQIEKDQLLAENGAVKDVQWAFTQSDVTGGVGPSGPLKEALEQAGIKWYIRP